jgi:TonB family protein
MELHSLVFKTLADASVRSLVLALAALAAMWLARARSAPARHAVWTAVVCAMLLLPVLSVALPSIPLRILPAAPEIALAPAPMEASGPAQIRTAPAPAPPRPQRDWTSLALPVWLLVATALLGRLVFGYAFCRRLLRGSTPIRDPRVSEALERLGAMPALALAESESISVPLTVGWIEPSILLPPGWRAWDQAKMEAVLAHEIAHVRRSDWLVTVLSGVNRSLFWFHPLAWWTERRLTALAEEACDESSLEATGNRERYAEVLLEMAEAVRRSHGRLTSHAVAMARRSQVRQRIETVLDERRGISRGMTKARWAAVLLCGVPLVYGAAALQVQPAQRPATVKAQSLEEHPAASSEPKLIQRVRPVYPPLAKQARIQGTVHLTAKIGKDGHVEEVQFVSGHPLLVPAAEEAVRKWVYEPVLVNGEPVEMLTDIDVNFSLIEDQAAPQPPGGSATRARGGGSVQPAKLIEKVDPVYPALAKQARVQGAVSVEVTIGKDGRVRKATAMSGPPLLRRAAEEAVEHWVYAPGRLNGEPVEVVAQEVVRFGLQRQDLVPPEQPPTVATPGAASAVQEAKVISRVPPVYPPLARRARVMGVVRVEAIIGVDGRVRQATAISGPPLLRAAAVEAVQQWEYRPALLDGKPVEVTTQVDVGFHLPASLSLALRIERSGGQLVLQWNREAEVLLDAQRATLTIVDGDHTEEVPVEPAQLRSGSIVYAPATGDVLFRLEVVSREGKSVSESVRVLDGRP